jgi:hypothetical protein
MSYSTRFPFGRRGIHHLWRLASRRFETLRLFVASSGCSVKIALALHVTSHETRRLYTAFRSAWFFLNRRLA